MTSRTGEGRRVRPGRRLAAAAVGVVALGAGVWAASAGAYVYWNGQGGGIGYSYLDGSGPAPLVAGAGSSCGVVLSTANIYWIDRQSQSIVEAGLDGGGAHAIVASPNLYGDSCYLAIDGGFIYWANPAEGTIGRATLSGASPNPNFVLTGGTPEGVAVDGSYVYYADVRNDVIGRANINGTGSGGSIIGGLSDPTSLAVNGSYIYWGSTAAGGIDTIGRARLQGPTWPIDVNVDFIALPVGEAACGIALDASYIYWALPGSASVGRASLDGSGPNSEFVVAPPGGVGCGVAADGAGGAPPAGPGTPAGGGSQAAFLDALPGTSFAQGGPTAFTVPGDVSALVVDAHGGDGGSGWAGGGGVAAAGGEGGSIKATIGVGPTGPITPGEQLEVFVGFNGADAQGNAEASGGDPGGGPGAGGGGGGGGYTALCKAGTSERVAGAPGSCLLIAAGGGGGGGPGWDANSTLPGGVGASASAPGGGAGAALGELGGGGPGPSGVSGGVQPSGGGGGAAGSLSELAGYAGASGALSDGGGGGEGSGAGDGGGGGGGGFGGGGGGGGGGWSGPLSAPSVWSGGGGGGAGASLLPAGADTVPDSAQPMLAIGYVLGSDDGTQPPSTTSAQARGSAGAASVRSGGAVTITLSCNGPAGSSCRLTAALSVTETIVSGRITAVAADRQRRPKATRRTVTIGRVSLTLSGGQRRAVTLTLNRHGRQLLAAHSSVKARLVVKQSVDAGPAATIKSELVSLSVRSKARR